LKSEEQKIHKRFLDRVDKNRLLAHLPRLHDEAFQQVDCLDCSACCKNYSPRFNTTDIRRISKYLRMKESQFIDTYLKLDTDHDYVVKSTPCPFLSSDNYCSIYEVRPRDCERFPYTDEDVFIKKKNITLKNATFCPAVVFVLERLEKILG
jgi:uncharacterized protein